MKFSGFFLLSIGMLLAACSSEEQNTGEKKTKVSEREEISGGYHDYFFPTAKDGETRYYLYDEYIYRKGEDTLYSISTKRVERLNDSIVIGVEHRHYPEITVPVDSSVILVDADGARVIESFYNDPEKGWVPLEVTGVGYTVRWDWEINEPEVSGWQVKSEGEIPPVKIEISSAFTGKGMLNKAFNGNAQYRVRSGIQERRFGRESSRYNVEIWDLQHTGMYRYRITAPGYDYTMTLKKILSKDAYKAQFTQNYVEL